MEQPSSKVTVEYFDPYSVYQLLSPGLLPRLPLRNLHWESHAGPLRSISSLHIDLVPATQAGDAPSTDNNSTSSLNLSRVKSEDSAASGDDGFQTQALGHASDRSELTRSPSVTKPRGKERRHQIPGLRQTPYLKIFLLRCDDNEAYKVQARQVREWVKEHTPQKAAKQSAQENHDAFEWLILHVVVPNTAAATQPRTSGKSSESSSGATAEKTTTRWRGSGSSTILERLRTDFNSSKSGAVDRIAQIRIGVNDVPYDMLPRVVPAIPGSYTETPQENENSWLDLLSKLKSLILSSFDMRVGEYEEDIKEKDAQRSLPGWNFCTFFVLKEGLARGFESVGLVEDALVGYDELAIGLDAIIREQSTLGPDAQHGSSFLPYTKDLRQIAERARAAILKDVGDDSINVEMDEAIDLQSSSDSVRVDIGEIPLNAAKKRYRELILSNDISIFDFRCYIFARQLSLLLRLANAWSSKDELLARLKEQRESSLQGVAPRHPGSQPSEDAENLATLALICKRSMDFVASISRIIRDDIWASQASETTQGEDEREAEGSLNADPIMSQVVNNIASSFLFAVTQQILAQTSTKALPIPPSTLAPPSAAIGLDGQEQKAAIPEPKTMMHPARSSSLAIRAPRESSSSGGSPRDRRSSFPEQGATPSPFLKAGLEELAARRAELYLLSRNILEEAGEVRGWSAGWKEAPDHYDHNSNGMQDVDLNDGSVAKGAENLTPSLHGIDSKLLLTAIDNKDDFYRLYETFTDKALRHYTVAGHTQSVLVNMADLAVLKYHLQDFAAAASYFYRMTPSYGQSGWSQVELPMLMMYATSLKKLERKEEFVRVAGILLERLAVAERQREARTSTLQLGVPSKLDDGDLVHTSYLRDLLEVTKSLQHDVKIRLQNFFSRIEIDGTPRYHPEMDSFALQVQLQYLLPEDLPIEKAKVRLVSTSRDIKRDIWLETTEPFVLKQGIASLMVQSHVNIPGTYVVNHVSLHTNNITLYHDAEVEMSTLGKSDAFFKCPKLLIYHRATAFDIKASTSKDRHLDRGQLLELEVTSGWNDVTSGELHIRAATAGLRLQTSEVKVIEGNLELLKKVEVGVVRFSTLAVGSSARLSLPYTIETESTEISVRLEVSYTTEHGTFIFSTTPTISTSLPLGVNVQDIFKDRALFSKFAISSSTSSPVRLLKSHLDGSNAFEAETGLSIAKPIVIYPNQPASVLYKITRRKLAGPAANSGKSSKTAFSLELHYICLEEEIENVVTQSLQEACEKTAMHAYSRLVIPTVVGELRRRSSPYDLERIALLSEISTSILSNIRWQDHFLGLGRTEDNKDVATLLAEGLQAWQQEMALIPLLPLSTSADTIAVSRSIVIPVEIPSISVVHTADLQLLKSSLFPASTPIAASNQPILASLNIKCTRMWDASLYSGKENSSQPAELEFVYEVSGASDTWLIGGRRKGHFKVPRKPEPEDSRRNISFPIALIPLREGFLPFPNVDIRPASRLAQSGTEESNTRMKVSCETDHKNLGETIRVISDARKTTVSLDASGPQGGAMLLDCEWRGSEGVVSS